MDWIKVNERLPEKEIDRETSSPVLIFINPSSWGEAEYNYTTKKWQSIHLDLNDAKITHWCNVESPREYNEELIRVDLNSRLNRLKSGESLKVEQNGKFAFEWLCEKASVIARERCINHRVDKFTYTIFFD